MEKYYVNICSCGGVHFIENELLYNVFEKNGSVIHVCTNCGITYRIWEDVLMDGCSISSKYVGDGIINTGEYKIREIICSEGQRILMNTGGYANFYGNGRFLDLVDGDFSKEYMSTVNTQAVIKMINDEDKLRVLSNKYTNIDWSNTKYKR